jgi:hypothetical protein
MFCQARSGAASMWFVFYGPFAFVIGGTQHVIANVGFLGLPMLLAALHAPVPHSGIGCGFGGHDFLTSLCIAALGSLIGGTLFSWPCRFRSSDGCSTERTKAGVTARTAAHTSALGDDIAPGTTAAKRGETKLPSHDVLSFIRRSATNTRKNHPPSS